LLSRTESQAKRATKRFKDEREEGNIKRARALFISGKQKEQSARSQDGLFFPFWGLTVPVQVLESLRPKGLSAPGSHGQRRQVTVERTGAKSRVGARCTPYLGVITSYSVFSPFSPLQTKPIAFYQPTHTARQMDQPATRTAPDER